MTDDQTVPAPAIDTPKQGTPPVIQSIGFLLLVIGLLLAIWDVAAMRTAVTELKREVPDALLLHYWVNLSIYLDMGVLFVIGGLALVFNRVWGRSIGYLAACSCFIVWFAAFALGGVVKRLVEEGEIPMRPKPFFYHFDLPLSVTWIGAMVALMTVVLLSLPAVGSWARSRPRVISNPDAKLSGLAIGSFICSLSPIPPFVQIIGLALGAASLRQIKKANGARRGKSLAVAGIAISLWVMVLFAALALAVIPAAR